MVGGENGEEAMKKGHIIFPCGNLKLEGIYYEAGTTEPRPAVVVCHPHPMYGGSMDNNVTLAIARALNHIPVNALLFNFRGVGRSEGSYGEGIAERDDIKAALDWLEKCPGVDKGRLGLAGYSFGAGVVLPVACDDARVKGFALVSPFLQGTEDAGLRRCTKPKLIVGGNEDDIIGTDLFVLYEREAAEPKQVQIVTGADHFWLGFEEEMSNIVAGFFGDLFIKNQGM
jgi:alpha/beta superfamily hydrolase